ncbi:SDR family NAD(P)-dependent oxidoreductase [Reichenbachiella carrageenanivorans]|uniref:SDR family NAD(P)-dependent oxidoreductase n=1 Tax=Reichenbachiella carrageenanivorans TaxID=2979869 RepID=A0ABY6D393_9BACT|nr:SDR family NAD(P)-dependent oxidoreductase [Reichenbachiella carrageenanivorans]UXX78305.1 SDR family NAD(P)-dependent oxidoreductase [Reichenbachiella carrageenanivorans]
MSLEGRVAIVTGASKGIGLEIVKQLLTKGVKVAGWSRTDNDITDPNYLFISVDVSDPESVAHAYRQTAEMLGENIDILVNNAGFGIAGPMDEMVFEDWKRMFDVNVHGIFFTSNAVIPKMKELDRGHIINISSIAGRNPVKGFAGYAGTKHAVTGISHSMFMELRDFGIKVTCIYPGSVNTNFFDDIDAVTANENMMRPEDVASSVVHCLETHPNYLPVDFEVRPLRPNPTK